MQRLRVRFSRGEDVKYISHLDLIRVWQRALNRAGIPLTYSRGFNPLTRKLIGEKLSICGLCITACPWTQKYLKNVKS